MSSSTYQDFSPQEANWTRLLHLMELGKPYLNPFLMQENLSGCLSVSNRTLCRLIGDHSNHNFCSFVNAYRLEEARRLLRDHSLGHLSIVDIATRSGFNSSAAFYRAFREAAEMSPTAYRRLYADRQIHR